MMIAPVGDLKSLHDRSCDFRRIVAQDYPHELLSFHAKLNCELIETKKLPKRIDSTSSSHEPSDWKFMIQNIYFVDIRENT